MIDIINEFRESIIGTTLDPVLVISPNKLNMLYIKAEPLSKAIIDLIESDEIGPHVETDQLASILQNHGWSENDSKQVWGFAPSNDGTNILINKTKGIRHVQEVQEYIIQGFRWCADEGSLCGEPFWGIKFSLIDCKLAEDKINRSIGQIMPTTRRACFGALLSSEPILFESFYKISVTVPKKYFETALYILKKRRGMILETKTNNDSHSNVILGQFPGDSINEIEKELQTASSGLSLVEAYFNHWNKVTGYPLRKDGGPARQYVEKIREHKGMKSRFPPDPEEYIDKL